MEADVQHLGRTRLALGIERVEGVLQVGVELLARVEALRRRKAHVVGVERVGQDEDRPGARFLPVGQVVGIGVGDVEEVALGGEFQRVLGGAAGVPAERRLARHRLVQRQRLVHVGALGSAAWSR